MLKSFFVYVLLLCSISSWSQERVTSKDFFLSAFGKFDSPQSSEVSVKVPIIQEMDFRTETRDFDPVKQEYTFRVKPNTPKLIKAQKNYSKELLNLPDFDEIESNCDHVRNVHEDWLDLYRYNTERPILLKVKSILNDQTKVLKRKRANLDFTISEELKTQKDLTSISHELTKNQLSIKSIKDKYGYKEEEFVFDDIISLQSLLSNLFTEKSDPNQKTEDQFEISLLENEIEIEKAEQNQILDFMQLRYRGSENNPINERVSLGLAFTLNTSADRKIKIKELQQEIERINRKRKRETEIKNQEINEKRLSLIRDVESLSAYEELANSEIKHLQSLSSGIAKSVGFDPLIILDIQSRLTEIEMEKLDQKIEIYQDYLDFLELNGAFCSTALMLLTE